MKSHDKNNMWPIPNERDVHYDKEEQLDIIWMKIRKRKRQNIFWILLPICIGFALYNYHNITILITTAILPFNGFESTKP